MVNDVFVRFRVEGTIKGEQRSIDELVTPASEYPSTTPDPLSLQWLAMKALDTVEYDIDV